MDLAGSTAVLLPLFTAKIRLSGGIMPYCRIKGIALVAALLPLAAMAQSAAPARTADPVELETVVVQVQKRPEDIQDVPRSLTVINGSTLTDKKIKTVDGLAGEAPNVSSSQANGVNTFSMRGIGGGGRNIGFDPRVGVYLDGMYMGQAAALEGPLLGIDQVVILRGPQGHLFGRNSVAGAISLQTAPPPGYFLGEGSVGFGSYGNREGYVRLGGPLTERLSGQVGIGAERNGGFTANRADGRLVDDRSRQSGRAQLRYVFSEDNTLDVFADRSRVRSTSIVGEPTTGFFGTPIPGGALPSRTVNFNIGPLVELDMGGVSANWSMQDGANRTWTVVAGNRSTRQLRRNDTDYSAADLIWVEYADHFTLSSLEARVATDAAKRSRFVAGVYLADEDSNTNRKVVIGNDTMTRVPVPGFAVLLPFGPAFQLAPGLGAQALGAVDTHSTALFGTWDFDLTDRWTTHLGGRYGRESKDVGFSLYGGGSGRLQIATLPSYRDSRSTTHFSPLVGVSYKVNDRTTAYGTYSNGFKSGGWNLDFLNVGQVATGFDFDDERVTSVEFGVKGETSGRKFSYEASVFSAKLDDYQVQQFVPLGAGGSVLQLRNAAQAHSRGVELQGKWRPAHNVDLGGYVGLLDAKFDRFPNGGAGGRDLAGNRLPEAPRATAAVDAAVRFPGPGNGEWQFSGQHRFRSTSYTGADNSANQVLGARHITDLRLEYRSSNGQWKAGLFVENALDEDADVYRNRDFFGHEIHKRTDPRMVGVDFTYNF